MTKWYVLPTAGPWVAVEAEKMELFEATGLLVFFDPANNIKRAFANGHWQQVSRINPGPEQ